MPLMARLSSLWRNLFRKDQVEQDLKEEVQAYLDLLIEMRIKQGLNPAEARRAALIEMGGVEQVKESVRDVRMGHFLEIIWQDLRYGARMLLKHKGITAIAAISLALGIGANTALFSIMDAMLLRRLPVKEPGRLVLFRSVAPPEFSPGVYAGYDNTDAMGQRTMTSFPYQSFQRIREQQSVLSDVFAFGDVSLIVNADGQSDVANGQAVSGNYYAGLGVQAMLGRTLTDEDDHAGASPVAVLSYRYWQHRFGGDSLVIGKQINLNNVPFTVIGITPPGFDGTMQAGSTEDVTITLAWEPQIYVDPQSSRMNGAGQWWLRVMGRLQPGATAEQAQAQLENAFNQSAMEHRRARQSLVQEAGGVPLRELVPQQYPRLYLDPGGQGEMNVRERYAPSLYLLLGFVGLVLLIACANVANLLLSRAAARQKEITVRLALGASRGRLVRQMLTESLLLACLGGTVGIIFALWIKGGLLSVSDWGGNGMRALEPQLDWRVLGFTMALSILTGIVFGLAPAYRATKVDLTPTLNDSGRSSGVVSRSWLSRGLVIFQMALSLLLLVGAGLFVRTLLNLQGVELGFNPRNLLLVGVQPELAGYKGERLVHVYEQLAERLEAVPGVQKATFSHVPLLAGVRTTRSVYLRTALAVSPDAKGSIQPSGQCHINPVRENFLGVMEIPLLAGRALSAQDDVGAPRVVVVNQSFANRYFPGESPIGKRFTFDSSKPEDVEIVGLVKDAKYTKQRDENPPTAYVPWRQGLRQMDEATFELRTTGNLTAIIAAVRQAVREVDANLPLSNIRTQIEQADQTLAIERLFAKLLTLFGLLAQLLAAIGLFGVMAYTVSQRRREIGIRLAIGADRSDILKMILRQGMALALVGVMLGLAGAYGLTKYLESRGNLSQMLYGVRFSDPLTYSVIAVMLTIIALLACAIPAWRATKVDPMVALRFE